MSGRTISMHFVEAAPRGARERDLDLWPILLEAGIPPVLPADQRARVTREQYAELIRLLWDALGDEFLGLGDFPCKRGTFAMMRLVMLGCPDLETGLRRAAGFSALFPTSLRFRTSTTAGGAWLEIDLGEVPDPDNFATESPATIWHRLIGWAIDQRVPLSGIEFGYPAPGHVAEYTHIFGCPMSFGHEVTSLTIDAAYLSAPIVQDEARRWARMASAPNDPPRPTTGRRHGPGSTSSSRLPPGLRPGWHGEATPGWPWRRRVTGTLLVVDAWFDVMTAAPGAQQSLANAMALVAELPLAVLCAVVALKASGSVRAPFGRLRVRRAGR